MAKDPLRKPWGTSSPASLPAPGSNPVLDEDIVAAEGIATTNIGDFLSRLKRNKLALVGFAIVLFWVVVALLGPLLVSDPTNPRAVNFADKFIGPFSHGHLLGTDDRGRDLLARTVYGARVSIAVGTIATAVSLVLGVLLGALAGYRGGASDALVMRLADVFFAFPYILGTIAIVTLLENSGLSERGFVPVFISIGILSWAYFARILRGQLLSLKEMDYVTAARAAGAGPMRILRKHLLPNAMPLLMVITALNVGSAVLAESALSFLGAGIQEPQASWGLMISQAVESLGTDNWFMVPPGLALASVVLAFVVIGDGLRDALDPRMRATAT